MAKQPKKAKKLKVMNAEVRRPKPTKPTVPLGFGAEDTPKWTPTTPGRGR